MKGYLPDMDSPGIQKSRRTEDRINSGRFPGGAVAGLFTGSRLLMIFCHVKLSVVIKLLYRSYFSVAAKISTADRFAPFRSYKAGGPKVDPCHGWQIRIDLTHLKPNIVDMCRKKIPASQNITPYNRKLMTKPLTFNQRAYNTQINFKGEYHGTHI